MRLHPKTCVFFLIVAYIFFTSHDTLCKYTAAFVCLILDFFFDLVFSMGNHKIQSDLHNNKYISASFNDFLFYCEHDFPIEGLQPTKLAYLHYAPQMVHA